MNNKEVIDQLFLVKALLEKSGNQFIFKDFGLTVSLYAPLSMVAKGISEISLLKKYSEETPASLTQKLKKLEELGLIDRKLDTNDKRKWHFLLTKKGVKALEKIDKKYEKVVKTLFQDFSENELENFFKNLKQLENRVKNPPKNFFSFFK